MPGSGNNSLKTFANLQNKRNYVKYLYTEGIQDKILELMEADKTMSVDEARQEASDWAKERAEDVSGQNYNYFYDPSEFDQEVTDWLNEQGYTTDATSAQEKIDSATEEARENNYSDEEYKKVRNEKFSDENTEYGPNADMSLADLTNEEKAVIEEDDSYSDDAAGLAEMLNDQNVADYEQQMNAALEGLQEAYDNGNDTTTLLGDYEQNVNDILAGMDSTENAAFNYGDYQNGLSSKVAEEVARSVGDTKLSNTTYDATRGTTAANYNNAVNQAISAANVANQGYKNMADLNQNTTNTAKTVADDLTAYKADMADSEYNAANSLRRSALNGYEEDDPLEKANDVTKAVSSGVDAGTTFLSLFTENGNNNTTTK